MSEEKTFEQQMDELEGIVNKLEQGDIPLEEALSQFQKGIQLSKKLQDKLENAETTLAHVIDDQGNETIFEKEDSNE
ncbi:exodeoxyribonuclease VII small subunit [Ligilactobacillus sp. LYQ135]